MNNFDFSNYTVKNVDDDNGIVFSNGATIVDYHYQYCCENVYCDWSQAEDLFLSTTFSGEPVIEKIEDCGIRINGFFFPCYNIQQNGNYSSELTLKFNYRDDMDISDCVQ